MEIENLIDRTLQITSTEVGHITCAAIDEAMAKIEKSETLEILPIWEFPTDDPEGETYNEYISENPWYQHVYVRESILKKIYDITKEFVPNWRLIIRAGHRPYGVQKSLLNKTAEKYLANNPEASPDEALTFARTYYSDPDQKLPPHTCGAAIDIDVRDLTTNELVDFGCPVNTTEPLSFWRTDELTPNQHENRIKVLTTMLKAGFAPFPNEWWHFSYGDQQWALFYGHTQSLYGLIEAEPTKSINL